MHTTHVSSGGRYPVLRTLAILYLVAAVGVFILGCWRAVNVLVNGDTTTTDMFGASTGISGRALVAVSWFAATIIAVLAMLGVAELIKLFIDIERNTRMAGMRSMASEVVATPSAVAVSPDAPTTVVSSADGTGGRMSQWLEGEETAEGALLRGH